MTAAKTLSRKDFKDYEFIFGEMSRLGKMSAVELMEYYKAHPEDTLSYLPDPQGSALPFTKSGEIRFMQIVDRGLKALGASAGRYNSAGVADSLKMVFMSGTESEPPV